MKKSIYAICGSAMITTAVLVRSIADGGSELVALLLIGAVLLVAAEKTLACHAPCL